MNLANQVYSIYQNIIHQTLCLIKFTKILSIVWHVVYIISQLLSIILTLKACIIMSVLAIVYILALLKSYFQSIIGSRLV